MKDYSIAKNKIETIFHELKIAYKDIDLQDDDINYIISFGTYGGLKSLKSINGILYLHFSDFSLNFIVLNIYTLGKNDCYIDTLDIYEVVNDINSEILCGKFLVEDNKSIIYKSSINCGDNYIGLDNQVVKKQIDIFLDSLSKMYIILKNKESSSNE